MNTIADKLTKLQKFDNTKQRDKILGFDGKNFYVGKRHVKFRRLLVFVRNVCIWFSCLQPNWINNKIRRIDVKNHQEMMAAMDQINLLKLKSLRVITVREAVSLLMSIDTEEFHYHSKGVAYNPEEWVMPFFPKSQDFFHENTPSGMLGHSKVVCGENEFEKIALRDYKLDLDAYTIKAKLRSNLAVANRQRRYQKPHKAFFNICTQIMNYNNVYYYTHETRRSVEINVLSDDSTLSLRNTTIHFYTDMKTSAGVAHACGCREMMEGRVIPYESFQDSVGHSFHENRSAEIGVVSLVMCGLVDGYHQEKYKDSNEFSVADFVAKRFPSVFTEVFMQWQSRLKERSSVVKYWNAFKQAFVRIDRMSSDKKGGASAIIAMVLDNNRSLYVSNVGDCRAILINEKGQIMQMSEDAKCDCNKEGEPNRYTRSVLKRGGFVLNNKVNGLIDSARTIGGYQWGQEKTSVHNPRPKNTVYSGPNLAQCWLVLCNSAVTSQASTREIAGFVNRRRKLKERPERIAAYIVEGIFRAGAESNIMVSVIPVGGMFQH